MEITNHQYKLSETPVTNLNSQCKNITSAQKKILSGTNLQINEEFLLENGKEDNNIGELKTIIKATHQ